MWHAYGDKIIAFSELESDIAIQGTLFSYRHVPHYEVYDDGFGGVIRIQKGKNKRFDHIVLDMP